MAGGMALDLATTVALKVHSIIGWIFGELTGRGVCPCTFVATGTRDTALRRIVHCVTTLRPKVWRKGTKALDIVNTLHLFAILLAC
jgi:hypothetical protein